MYIKCFCWLMYLFYYWLRFKFNHYIKLNIYHVFILYLTVLQCAPKKLSPSIICHICWQWVSTYTIFRAILATVVSYLSLYCLIFYYPVPRSFIMTYFNIKCLFSIIYTLHGSIIFTHNLSHNMDPIYFGVTLSYSLFNF